MKFPFQTWFWINRRILYIEMPFSYIKLFNWENIGYVAYPPEALFWSLKEDKYIHCRWMTSFVYLRNLATSDTPISGFPGCGTAVKGNLLDPRTRNKVSQRTKYKVDIQCWIGILEYAANPPSGRIALGRRRFVVDCTSLGRRCFDVVCPLGLFFM